MIKILLVGSGAREHAIARAIKKSPQTSALFCFASNNNPGIMELCEDYYVGFWQEVENINRYAVKHKIDFAIIGNETPLALGLVDILKKNNIPAIGPTKLLAQIESSKGFARDLLKIPAPTFLPKYRIFENLNGAKEFLDELGEHFVVKADGLMSGKGVKVSQEHLFSQQEALEYCQELLNHDSNFVIEEKLIGQEFSLLSFSDGKHLIHMPVVQDHKRAFANDTGPNTGGMGSYSDANHSLPFLNEEDIKQAQQLNQITIKALAAKVNEPYKGILYGGFMLTKNGIKLIEYNARFGDPEAINILALLKGDFIEICQAIINGTLNKVAIDFVAQATVCKYLVPEGYPENPKTGTTIDISAVTELEKLYYASVNLHENKLLTTSSRAIAVLGIGDSIKSAEQEAETIIKQIKGKLLHRQDIGTAQLINQRIEQINSLCHTNYAKIKEK
jgi:phosphoribosylamine--glycine ligase